MISFPHPSFRPSLSSHSCLRNRNGGINFTNLIPPLTFSLVLKDELSVAMALVGITDLSQAHPGLVNTGDLDHLVPMGGEGHPYAKWRRGGKEREDGVGDGKVGRVGRVGRAKL